MRAKENKKNISTWSLSESGSVVIQVCDRLQLKYSRLLKMVRHQEEYGRSKIISRFGFARFFCVWITLIAVKG